MGRHTEREKHQIQRKPVAGPQEHAICGFLRNFWRGGEFGLVLRTQLGPAVSESAFLSPAGLPLVTGYTAYDTHHSGTRCPGLGRGRGGHSLKTKLKGPVWVLEGPRTSRSLVSEFGHPMPPFQSGLAVNKWLAFLSLFLDWTNK